MAFQTKKFTLSLIVALLFAAIVAGQNSGSTVINFAQLDESGQQQQLSLFFTMLDETGNVITEVDPPPTASFLFENGANFENVSVQQARNPLYIVIALDASGSMNNAAEQMRNAAIEAVNNAPQEAQIAVYQFNRQVTPLSEFTADRGAVVNAIGSVNPPPPSDPNAGTCLYDATFQALAELEEAPPAARRAVILFTDGRDELTLNGDPCSEQTIDSVLTRATSGVQRTSIYTIGLRGDRDINAPELREIANTTGGIAEIGELEALPALFQRIISALSSQWVATGNVCVGAGQQNVILNTRLGNTALQSSTLVLDVTAGCQRATATPNPTITNTPLPTNIDISAFTFNEVNNAATVEIIRTGEIPVHEYRIQFNDASGGFLVYEDRFEASNEGATESFVVNATTLPASIEIVVTAFSTNGTVIDRVQSQTYEIQRATPTVPATAVPAGVVIDALSYDEIADSLQIDLILQRQDLMQDIEIDLFNNATNSLVNSFSQAAAEMVMLNDLSSLQPQTDYRIRVRANTTTGENPTAETTFAYQPLLTPTPTPTPTLTPTATPTAIPTLVPVRITIDSIAYDPASDQLTLSLDYQQEARIVDFVVDIQGTNGVLVNELRPELANQITLPTGGLEPSQDYIIIVRAETTEGERLRDERDITYNPPVTPTPTPTPAPELGAVSFGYDEGSDPPQLLISIDPQNPDPIERYDLILNNEGGLNQLSLTREPPGDNVLRIPLTDVPGGEYTIQIILRGANNENLSTVEESVTIPDPPVTPSPGIGDRLADNPVLAVLALVIFLILIALLVYLVTRLRQKPAVQVINPEPTQVFGMPAAGGQLPAQGDDKTIIDADYEQTYVDSHGSTLPDGVEVKLKILDSPNPSLNNREFIMRHAPYHIARRNADLSIEGDQRVSREQHATILFEDNKFYIRDEESSGGTFVDERRLEPHTLEPLPNSTKIKVGHTTIQFQLDEKTITDMPAYKDP